MGDTLRAVIATTVTALIASFAVLMQAPTAHAAGGWVSSSNGVLYDDCRNHSYSYRVSGARDWELDVDLIGPDGLSVDSDFLWDGSDSSRGRSSFMFCGWEMPGRYRIKATLTTYDEDYNSQKTRLPVRSFRMRSPRTRTSVSISDRTPHFNEVVTIKGRVKQERPRRYYPGRYAPVRLETRTPRGWVVVKQSKTYTNRNGVVRWKYRWNVRRTVAIRAVALREVPYSKSTSRPLWVDQRANGRVLVPRKTSGHVPISPAP